MAVQTRAHRRVRRERGVSTLARFDRGRLILEFRADPQPRGPCQPHNRSGCYGQRPGLPERRGAGRCLLLVVS